nr:KAT8 regulatory NSL complex subunit 3-like [Helicoverpa armigera]
MVMATGSVCQPAAGDLSHEAGEASDDASEAAALHERLVAYVHALAGGPEPRSGVWVEHSYARARGAAAAAHVRVLLAPRLPPDGALDVTALEPAPPPPPHAEPPAPDDSDGDDDWEARVAALAPSAVHARLAAAALDALRRMRLERLAGCLEAARAAARRLRLALAAAAAWPGAPGPRAGAWLHATLLSAAPRGARRLYEEAAAELRRMAPRVAERAMGAGEAAGALAVGRPVGGGAGPWLVWVGSGRARADERWTRRLGALVHVRVLEAGAAAAAPDAWCAAAAGGVRAALADVLQEAGDRAVVLGGFGAGAALCTALAGCGGARLRGLLLLAPPLLTAEGAREQPDDPLRELAPPVLLVVGSRAATCWRGAARSAARSARRRVLELRGADAALRLPRALRRRRRVPQSALDAAVADECARWLLDAARGAEAEAAEAREAREAREESPPRARRRRPERAELPDDHEEFAHLPPAALAPPAALTPPAAPAPAPPGSEEGRVVSRGPAGTPLALLPPRRAALAAADILRLPIVFADDAAPEPAPGVTVTAGRAHPYSRVIVASRAPAPRPARPTPRPTRPAPRPARPVLLRRGLRLVPRADPPL